MATMLSILKKTASGKVMSLFGAVFDWLKTAVLPYQPCSLTLY